MARPDVGVSRPQSMRMVVDLPAPLGPRNPKISPFFVSRLMRSTATKSPNRLTRSSTTTDLGPSFMRASLSAACHGVHKEVFDRGRHLHDRVEWNVRRSQARLELLSPSHRVIHYNVDAVSSQKQARDAVRVL